MYVGTLLLINLYAPPSISPFEIKPVKYWPTENVFTVPKNVLNAVVVFVVFADLS